MYQILSVTHMNMKSHKMILFQMLFQFSHHDHDDDDDDDDDYYYY